MFVSPCISQNSVQKTDANLGHGLPEAVLIAVPSFLFPPFRSGGERMGYPILVVLRVLRVSVVKFGSLDKHAIPIRVEPVLLVNGVFVSLQDSLASRERRDQH